MEPHKDTRTPKGGPLVVVPTHQQNNQFNKKKIKRTFTIKISVLKLVATGPRSLFSTINPKNHVNYILFKQKKLLVIFTKRQISTIKIISVIFMMFIFFSHTNESCNSKLSDKCTLNLELKEFHCYYYYYYFRKSNLSPHAQPSTYPCSCHRRRWSRYGYRLFGRRWGAFKHRRVFNVGRGLVRYWCTSRRYLRSGRCGSFWYWWSGYVFDRCRSRL